MELSLRGSGETSGLVQKHPWLLSLQSGAGAGHPEACWPVIFRPWKGSQDIVFAENRLSANACTGSTPASCQPYAVFFLWHPNTNVWIFAWLMRSYIRKASVGNIYKQANFLNENVLWISFLRRRRRKKNLFSRALILTLAVHSEVLVTLTPLLSSKKN